MGDSNLRQLLCYVTLSQSAWPTELIFFIILLFCICVATCPINLKRQSEHSGLRPDTSSLVIVLINLIFFQEKLGTINQSLIDSSNVLFLKCVIRLSFSCDTIDN